MIRFGSVCSGIEAASVAWHPLGWRAAWLSEIEPFPCAVLAHHYPDVPNLGDMTTLAAKIHAGEVDAPDVFCGGTPCQAFSVAGLRKSLDDARGNLSLTFCEIANAIDAVRLERGEQPATIFWENVPGVLGTKDNAFGCFLAGLAGEDDPLIAPGAKWTNAGFVLGPQRAVAWRVLDGQYFGVAQRRRRVFVVASARNGFDPAKVLFESEGVRRDFAPSREAGQSAAACLDARTRGGGFPGTDGAAGGHVVPVCPTLRAGGNKTGGDRPPGTDVDTAESLIPVAFDTTQTTSAANRGNPKPGDPCHPLAAGAHPPAIAFPANLSGTQCASAEEVSPSMGAKNPTAVAYTTKLHNTTSNQAGKFYEEYSPSLQAGSPGPAVCASGIRYGDHQQDTLHHEAGIISTLPSGTNNNAGHYTKTVVAMQVRRLTPVECERLMGFPDGYTAIPWRKKPADQCPDGPRYKALGNSWAVPVVRWIGARIDQNLTVLSHANDNGLAAEVAA